MMKQPFLTIVCTAVLLLMSPAVFAQTIVPGDKHASSQTKNLFRNLKRLSKKGFIFGHQDDLAYGVNWRYQDQRSDVKESAGDYPGIYGWELGGIEKDSPVNLDSVPFDKMKKFIEDGYQRGGVITISWHLTNIKTGGNAWDTTHGGVQSVLPGGENHDRFKTWLDKVAAFISSLKGKNGEAIPILFRPYHEFTGNWFWWCRNTCTASDFISLWKMTVDYLRNEKKLHNILYVYNTSGNFSSQDEFMERYPGDDYADVLSFDTYQYGDPQKTNAFPESVNKDLKIVCSIADQKNKLCALAETGYEAIPYAEWWTKTLLPAIGDNHISYVLVWRNHGMQKGGHMHYYAPYKGQVSENDFVKFYKLDKTFFEKDLKKEKLYH